jgi:hypothetical protein
MLAIGTPRFWLLSKVPLTYLVPLFAAALVDQ